MPIAPLSELREALRKLDAHTPRTHVELNMLALARELDRVERERNEIQVSESAVQTEHFYLTQSLAALRAGVEALAVALDDRSRGVGQASPAKAVAYLTSASLLRDLLAWEGAKATECVTCKEREAAFTAFNVAVFCEATCGLADAAIVSADYQGTQEKTLAVVKQLADAHTKCRHAATPPVAEAVRCVRCGEVEGDLVHKRNEKAGPICYFAATDTWSTTAPSPPAARYVVEYSGVYRDGSWCCTAESCEGARRIAAALNESKRWKSFVGATVEELDKLSTLRRVCEERDALKMQVRELEAATPLHAAERAVVEANTSYGEWLKHHPDPRDDSGWGLLNDVRNAARRLVALKDGVK